MLLALMEADTEDEIVRSLENSVVVNDYIPIDQNDVNSTTSRPLELHWYCYTTTATIHMNCYPSNDDDYYDDDDWTSDLESLFVRMSVSITRLPCQKR